MTHAQMPALKFSANLGFLWTELDLPCAIQAAAKAGFAAVECHWPYDTPAADVSRALADTGLAMLGINTVRGDRPGDMGLAALSDRKSEAKAAIDQAISYASAIDARAVHVMAGCAQGDAALQSFIDNLHYACAQAEKRGITILIEPLNVHDAPGYFLQNTKHARSIIATIGAPNLKLMFDCYHVGRAEGDVIATLKECMPTIGHIQFASVPDRGPPGTSVREELDYNSVFAAISALGWTRPLGAEYRPTGTTEDSLRWMNHV